MMLSPSQPDSTSRVQQPVLVVIQITGTDEMNDDGQHSGLRRPRRSL